MPFQNATGRRWTSDATLLCQFDKGHFVDFGEVLRVLMFFQMAGRAVDLILFFYDGMSLQGSAMETEDGNHSFATQVEAHISISSHEVAKCRRRIQFFRAQLSRMPCQRASQWHTVG